MVRFLAYVRTCLAHMDGVEDLGVDIFHACAWWLCFVALLVLWWRSWASASAASASAFFGVLFITEAR